MSSNNNCLAGFAVLENHAMQSHGTGALMGGISGYISANRAGANPWTGKMPTTTQPNSSEDLLATMLRNEANHGSPGLGFEGGGDFPPGAIVIDKILREVTVSAAYSVGDPFNGIAMSMAMQMLFNSKGIWRSFGKVNYRGSDSKVAAHIINAIRHSNLNGGGGVVPMDEIFYNYSPYAKMGNMQPGINIHQTQVRLGNTKSYFTVSAEQYVDVNGNFNPNINFSKSMTITKPLFKSQMQWTFMGSTRYYDQYRWGVPTEHFNLFKNYMYP